MVVVLKKGAEAPSMVTGQTATAVLTRSNFTMLLAFIPFHPARRKPCDPISGIGRSRTAVRTECPVLCRRGQATHVGFEPTISCVTGKRDNRFTNGSHAESRT